jgi:hypothetical protein
MNSKPYLLGTAIAAFVCKLKAAPVQCSIEQPFTVSLNRPTLAAVLLLGFLGLDRPVLGESQTTLFGARHIFADSIKAPTPGVGARIKGDPATNDLNGTIDFAVSLKMRNFGELESRIGRGERISQAEMEASYLPSAAEYTAVQCWLRSQGFTITQEDVIHTSVFAKGTVAQVQAAMGVTFAKVATADGEFTSAISAPSLPAEISENVIGVVGLQPHIRAHAEVVTSEGPGLYWVVPSDLLRAYNAPGTLDGTGQTIAVIMASDVPTGDLRSFYAVCGSKQQIENVTQYAVNGGPTPASQSDFAGEAPGDLEWSSGMAAGAKVRLYAPPDLKPVSIFAACSQILADAKANNITVVSMSLGYYENGVPSATFESGSQSFAALGAAGITVLAASGDSGSNSGGGNGTYSPDNPLTLLWPASDPNVAGVGGTNMNFDPTTFAEVGESPWNTIPAGGPVAGQKYWATGGGYSGYFAKPSWQTQAGNNILGAARQRCVPDVAAISTTNGINPANLTLGFSPYAGSFYPYTGLSPVAVGNNGNTDGPALGTSLACPIWAGIVALLNQARANQGLGPIGLLGPAIYPLAGTNAFTDITGNINNGGVVNGAWFPYSDGNGAYQVGPGYDLCTGLGTPNIANLAAALTRGSGSGAKNAPVFTTQPISVTVTGGTVALNAQASNSPTYQWYLNGTVMMPGATDPILLLTDAASAAGSYTCVATNAAGSSTSSAATVSLTSTDDIGRLVNISCRAGVGTGGDILITGFAVGGAGTYGSEPLLIRASGPALVSFGVAGTLPDPQLQIFSGGTVLGTNNGWGGTSAIASTAAAVGAFAWNSPTSHDSALLQSLVNGPYTAQIAGQSGDTGIALAEVYDATPAGAYTPASPRLVNISARVQVGTAGNILIAGFVVGGSTSRTVLIRASGPALVPFGVAGTLPDPELQLYSGSTLLGMNEGWGGETEIASAAASEGAFIWDNPASNDSALLVTLPPGAYTAQVFGASGDTGVALVEVYEVL